MKTKAIVILAALWMLISGLDNAGLFDAIPIENENVKDWIKWAIAAIGIFVGIFKANPSVAKDFVQRTVNPTPKPPKPPKP
jgi:hypothetical protein